MLIALLFGAKRAYDTFYAIFPSARQYFNYSEKPILVTLDNGVYRAEYKIPKAYFSRKLYYKEDGRVSTPLALRASFNDNMAPWTLSESFKKRDPEGPVYVYIDTGYIDEYRKKFPYYEINSLQKRSLGASRGEYKKIFMRYDGALSKSWLSDGSYKLTLGEFFLIPKTEDAFIRCPANINKNIRCSVSRHYGNISYKFLIPHRNIERYKEYDDAVRKLIDRLMINSFKYQPSTKNYNESK
jgi:hypothetical protein